jgi:hypothetical protein
VKIEQIRGSKKSVKINKECVDRPVHQKRRKQTNTCFETYGFKIILAALGLPGSIDTEVLVNGPL